MSKPKVLFPYTEAGLGHIKPMNSIADEFERLYGDKVECIRSNFFTEPGDKNLAIFEQRLKHEVEKQNKVTAYGFFGTFNMELWRIHLSTWATMKFLKFGNRKPGVAYMDEIKPDLVVSTHWATNYYAVKSKCNPLTVMYCPDAEVNPLFSYKCDLVMVSTPTGFEKALKKHPIRFNEDNLKRVNILIRKEAFGITDDKRALRLRLGFDPDKFTVILAEGGYGIGKMSEICRIILKRDLPVNLVAVFGKNEEAYREFKDVRGGKNTSFYPLGLIDNMLEVMASGDIFCGKSGANTVAEACFFGLPIIITKYATAIEKKIGNYYLDYVGNAMKIFEPSKVVDRLEDFLSDPQAMRPYSEAAKKQRDNYGATLCADYIFDLLCTRFPELRKDI